MKKEDSIKQIIGSLIRISQKYSRIEKTPMTFDPHWKIYPSQAHMLVSLRKLKRANITELSRHLNITKASVVETIDKLQKKGLLFRSKNPDNEKEVYVELSKTGQSISLKIIQHHETLIKELIKTIKKAKGLEYNKVYEMLSGVEQFFDNSTDKEFSDHYQFIHPSVSENET